MSAEIKDYIYQLIEKCVLPKFKSNIRGHANDRGFSTKEAISLTLKSIDTHGTCTFFDISHPDVIPGVTRPAFLTDIIRGKTQWLSITGGKMTGNLVIDDAKITSNDLTTTATDVEGAINELNANILALSGGTTIIEVDAKIGTLSDLTTTAQGNLVAAVNEVDGQIGTLTTTQGSLGTSIIEVDAKIGTLSDLTTTAQGNLVAAVNEVDGQIGTLTTTQESLGSSIIEVDAKIGTLSDLTTTAQGNLVAAVNEVDGQIGTLTTTQGSLGTSIIEVDARIGTLSDLTTTAQGNLVAAVNEVDANMLALSGGTTTNELARRPYMSFTLCGSRDKIYIYNQNGYTEIRDQFKKDLLLIFDNPDASGPKHKLKENACSDFLLCVISPSSDCPGSKPIISTIPDSDTHCDTPSDTCDASWFCNLQLMQSSYSSSAMGDPLATLVAGELCPLIT